MLRTVDTDVLVLAVRFFSELATDSRLHLGPAITSGIFQPTLRYAWETWSNYQEVTSAFLYLSNTRFRITVDDDMMALIESYVGSYKPKGTSQCSTKGGVHHEVQTNRCHTPHTGCPTSTYKEGNLPSWTLLVSGIDCFLDATKPQ